MRLTRVIILLLITVSILGYNKHLFSWGLFDLFSDTNYSREGLKRTLSFDPDDDILYLPSLDKSKDIFASINDLSICRIPSVRKYIYLYLTSAREYLVDAITKSHLYLPIITRIFQENPDIPEELALLPLLESGFNPYAVSRSRAVGLWQFVKNTAKPLGLKMNHWVDERRDIEKSTEAAIRHLKHLYNYFGSWELALAAYNGGAGHVKRAILNDSTNNIWELRHRPYLHDETREYLPKFIALVLIYKNQHLFGIKEEITPPEQIQTDIVELKYAINLEELSVKLKLPTHLIRTYNPELRSTYTPPYEKNYSLRIPRQRVELFEKEKKILYRNRISGVRTYRIREGDCLSKIANRFKKKPLFS